MNKLTTAKRVAVVAALVEGNSVRATARMTNVSKPTILKLLSELGEACAAYHDAYVRGLKCERIQVDEIWSFIGAKAKNASDEKKLQQSWGDCWTWNAICADSKLIVSYLVGPRSPRMAFALMNDVAARLDGRVQLTTDGLYWYLWGALENVALCSQGYATEAIVVPDLHASETPADASFAQADRLNLSALRSDRQPLSKNSYGRHFWASELPQ